MCDEATANIDGETESEIQRLLHQGFSDSTVLIIAHRLKTIMACGRIMVMDKGKVVEMGTFEL